MRPHRSERPSTIRMVQKARKNGLPFWNKSLRSGLDQVAVAFQAFQKLSNVIVRPMTAISALSDIHKDICASAKRKRAGIVILPFHKHQRLDGALEVTRHEFRSINRRVLENAPCSVGILVDRGFGGTTQIPAKDVSSSVVALFFGGRDDREALAYGMRMAEHPGIQLTVVRFNYEPKHEMVEDSIVVETHTDSPARQVNAKFLNEFRQKIQNNLNISYEERSFSCGEECATVIQAFSRCNLILVGRNPEGAAALALMTERSECPELGPLGNLLTSPSFSTPASVLDVQQHPSQNTETESSPCEGEIQ